MKKTHDDYYRDGYEPPIGLRELVTILWPAALGLTLAFVLIWLIGCVPVTPPKPPSPPVPPAPTTKHLALKLTDEGGRGIPGATAQIQDTPGWVAGTANGDGLIVWTVTASLRDTEIAAAASGYVSASVHRAATRDTDENLDNVPLARAFPDPPTRDEILDAHESFQGAILHTSQFGDLFWWPTAWVSLNAADREASYAQIASWGDTDITVSASWSYGENGQPYGDGQLVPNTNYFAGADYASADVAGFRSAVEDVIQHQAANGQPFVPRIFMEGDNGYAYYMWAMPLIVKALQPQPGDPIDLTAYVKLQMCYDSCVPGYAGAADDKSLINDAILATRAACPACVIALEFSTGYSSTGDGDGWWQTAAAKALDEVDWEGNSWPPTNWEQYWEILDRWLGPAYIRPPQQKSDPSAPFPITDARFYLRNGTPRGRYGVQCFEPYTYQWVRGGVSPDQVPVAWQAMHALGCPVIDTPYPAGQR